MFCPKCSQQQISDNIRFCSRCGFHLSVVKALIVDGDASLPKPSEFAAPNPSQRKRDLTIGALLMFLFAFHSAWTTEDLSLEGKFTGLIIKCLILCVLINIIPMIRNFFRRRATRNSLSSPEILSGLIARFKNRDQNSALPAAYGRPAAHYFTGGINTAKILAPPPSVTEETTNLLSRNPN
jgi:hypothetical protein